MEQDWLDCRVATVEAEEAMKTMAAAMIRRRQQDRAGVGGAECTVGKWYAMFRKGRKKDRI